MEKNIKRNDTNSDKDAKKAKQPGAKNEIKPSEQKRNDVKTHEQSSQR